MKDALKESVARDGANISLNARNFEGQDSAQSFAVTTMTSGKRCFFSMIGRLMVTVSGFVLLLFVTNIRSRLYYHGPNYSFLFWMFLYALLTGIGIMRLKKWGVLLLCLPPIGMTLELGVIRFMESGSSVTIFINLVVALMFAAVPALMLRNWAELHW